MVLLRAMTATEVAANAASPATNASATSAPKGSRAPLRVAIGQGYRVQEGRLARSAYHAGCSQKRLPGADDERLAWGDPLPMRLGFLTGGPPNSPRDPKPPKSELVADAMDCYVDWREECAAVEAAVRTLVECASRGSRAAPCGLFGRPRPGTERRRRLSPRSRQIGERGLTGIARRPLLHAEEAEEAVARRYSFVMKGSFTSPSPLWISSSMSSSVDVSTTLGLHGRPASSVPSSIPSRSGSPTSTSAAWGWVALAAVRAEAASTAVATTSPPFDLTTLLARARKSGSSSTMRIDTATRRSSQAPAPA